MRSMIKGMNLLAFAFEVDISYEEMKTYGTTAVYAAVTTASLAIDARPLWAAAGRNGWSCGCGCGCGLNYRTVGCRGGKDAGGAGQDKNDSGGVHYGYLEKTVD